MPMKPTSSRSPSWLLLLLLPMSAVLIGCSGSSGDQTAADNKGVVAVSTAPAKQQAFHDTVQAWGSAISDPRRARTISLGHGGQLEALKVSSGEPVHRGQPLLVVTPDPTSRSAYQQAVAARDAARADLARTRQLASQRLATQSQLAIARKALTDAQAVLDAQRALGGTGTQETLAAPADGVVTTINVAQGERFASNAPLLTFTPSRALVAQLGVQPPDGAKLHVGMAVKLHGVYGAANTMIGTLAVLGEAIDPQSHMLPATVTLPASASATLVAGAPLQASIQASDFTAWAVPRDAVLHDDKGDYLFQVEQGKARRVDVTLLSGEGDPVGVSGSLDAKARVIVKGVYELEDGDAVREARP